MMGGMMKTGHTWFAICGLFFAVNGHAQTPGAIKAMADKVEVVQGNVLQMVNEVNSGMLIKARIKANDHRTTHLVFVVNYPGHTLREGGAISRQTQWTKP